jgi:large subunit ribosomal protein L9
VKSGFGRNYLLPGGKATLATPTNVAKFEERRAELEKIARDQLVSAEERQAALKEYKLVIRAKAGTEGKLFGSVGTADISEALKRENFNVARSEVRLPNGALRTVGDHVVSLHLHADIDVPLAISIVAEE